MLYQPMEPNYYPAQTHKAQFLVQSSWKFNNIRTHRSQLFPLLYKFVNTGLLVLKMQLWLAWIPETIEYLFLIRVSVLWQATIW